MIERVADSVERYSLKVSGADMAAVLWIIGALPRSLCVSRSLVPLMARVGNVIHGFLENANGECIRDMIGRYTDK